MSNVSEKTNNLNVHRSQDSLTNVPANLIKNQKHEPRKLEIQEHITRDEVIAEKDKNFIFGDNLTGQGLGGQAKEMCGEENSVGIPTKKASNNNPNSFFIDQEFTANKKAIDEAFSKIPPHKTVVIPKAGLGTGLAKLQEKAPKTFAYLGGKPVSIGFNNQTKEQIQVPKAAEPSVDTEKNKTLKSSDTNKVFIQTKTENLPTARHLSI